MQQCVVFYLHKKAARNGPLMNQAWIFQACIRAW
jgi:hypothetical protein